MISRNSSPRVDIIGNLVWEFGPPQFRSYLYNCLNSHLFGAPAPLHSNDGLLAFLPEGGQEDDGSAGPGFVERVPSETRPLTMKNTDNKLIAAAVTYAAIPTFKDTVNIIQQGFVPGRNFVGNVVQLDFESRVNALRCFNNRNDANPECMLPPHSVGNLACSVLFDFAAAFPSVLQAWLLFVLKAIQAPEGFINSFIFMYSENHAYTRSQGGLVLMFKVFSGVLQGCPSSGALFNVGIDSLMLCFSCTIVQPGLGKVFDCADDLGVALCSLHALIS